MVKPSNVNKPPVWLIMAPSCVPLKINSPEREKAPEMSKSPAIYTELINHLTVQNWLTMMNCKSRHTNPSPVHLMQHLKQKDYTKD
jgi:hypothetical protein